jgi:hypothetical protein
MFVIYNIDRNDPIGVGGSMEGIGRHRRDPQLLLFSCAAISIPNSHHEPMKKDHELVIFLFIYRIKTRKQNIDNNNNKNHVEDNSVVIKEK